MKFGSKSIMKGSYDSGYRETEYEKNHKLLYIKVNPTIESTGYRSSKSETKEDVISNIGIYDLDKETTTYFFEKNTDKRIKLFIYEVAYYEKEEEDEQYFSFNTYPNNIINNNKVPKRPVNDSVLIITEGKEKGESEFWLSDKHGKNTQLIKRTESNTIWKLDVLNKKLIFIHKLTNELKVESVDW